MRATDIGIRPAGQADLEAINRVIEAAVMTWHLPDRVKRLSLPAYRYDSVDLVHLDIVLAEDSRQNIIGIAAWEQATTRESPAGSKVLSSRPSRLARPPSASMVAPIGPRKPADGRKRNTSSAYR